MYFSQIHDSIISGSNIQHLMFDFHKENTIFLKNKYQGIIPKNMIEYMVNHNSFVSDAYMEDISDMICKIYYLHLNQYFILQQPYLNFQHFYYHYRVSTPVDI